MQPKFADPAPRMATRNSTQGDLESIDWSRIHGVVFDLVGTLMRPVPSAAEAYREAGARFGQTLSAADAAERFREAFSRQEAVDRQRNGLRTSQQRERERWQAIVAEVFPEAEDGGPLFAELWVHFGRAEHWRAFDDVPTALIRCGSGATGWPSARTSTNACTAWCETRTLWLILPPRTSSTRPRRPGGNRRAILLGRAICTADASFGAVDGR